MIKLKKWDLGLMMKKGQSMFELIFAIAIATIILTGVVTLATTSVRNSSASRDNSLANRFAQEVTEWLRGERDSYVTWTDFVSDRAGGKTWCLNTSPITAWPASAASCLNDGTDEIGNTMYLREVTLTNVKTVVSDDTVNVVVNVSWVDTQGEHTTTHTTRLTNWQE